MSACQQALTLEFLKDKVTNINNQVKDTTGHLNESWIITTRLIYEINYLMQHHLESEMSKFGLVGESWIVLMVIFGSSKQTIIANDICQHLHKNKATTSRIVDSLIQKNFLERLEDICDRRKIFLRITQEGKNFINERIQAHAEYHKAIWENVNLENLMKETIKVHHNLKKAEIK